MDHTPHLSTLGVAKLWDLINYRVLAPLIQKLEERFKKIEEKMGAVEGSVGGIMQEINNFINEFKKELDGNFLRIDSVLSNQKDIFKNNVGDSTKTPSGNYALDDRYYTKKEVDDKITTGTGNVTNSFTTTLRAWFKAHHDSRTSANDYWSHDDTYLRIDAAMNQADVSNAVTAAGITVDRSIPWP